MAEARGLSPYGYRPEDWERFKGLDAVEEAERVPEEGKDYRPPFARDHDRLIYTTAFRRLQGKTQVVTPGEADFFHTRLTHTIEVAQIARRLAEYLNARALHEVKDLGEGHPLTPWGGEAGFVDPDVCEAAAILHDLGHPPFGHAGEEALGRTVQKVARTAGWDIDLQGGFEGNAQSFHMATQSIVHKPGVPGLQLTRAVLDAAVKYPWFFGAGDADGDIATSEKKWSFYNEDSVAADWVREHAPDGHKKLKSVEAEIVEWADDIAYSVHDLDDWFRAGFMPLAELAHPGQELDRLSAAIVERKGITDDEKKNEWDAGITALFTRHPAFYGFRQDRTSEAGSVADPESAAAREAIRAMRQTMFDGLTTRVGLVRHEHADDSWSHRYALRLEIEPSWKRRNEILQQLLWIYVVGSKPMATHQRGHERVVAELFEIFAAAAVLDDDAEEETKRLAIYPVDLREKLRNETDKTNRLRIVTDYVSGMTDAYALRSFARLTGAGGPFSEFV